MTVTKEVPSVSWLGSKLRRRRNKCRKRLHSRRGKCVACAWHYGTDAFAYHHSFFPLMNLGGRTILRISGVDLNEPPARRRALSYTAYRHSPLPGNSFANARNS